MSTILELIVDKWATVRAENERDKELVTDEQRTQWEDFEAKTTARLKTIVQGYDGVQLSDTDTDWLRNLDKTIDRADRVDRESLEQKNAAREEAARKKAEEERQRLEAEKRKAEKLKETKAGLLGKLGF